ncbi:MULTISPECIES: RBBP9/YdeN family alpha/beta hydrolase [Comamonas]|uniref:Alpha/beta hydrolase n=1 Tax=Comamonas squillarum TaxID=2977320 RepID=A0ABY5ZZ02_9BURK|nr:alpha/beta hydrolase [Comamonas sp. PR12]UXC18696.1 alpha/beta hydrolase [Comamonas sp. PR12]
MQPGWRGEAETGAQVSVVIVPGWRNSGPGHWQSLWAERIAGALRVEQEDWLQPHRSPWVASVQEAIEAAPHPVILVAHSLGCITSVHAVEQLGNQQRGSIAGALLVAPADPERRALFEDFTPVPANPLPFASIVAASSNDPYCPIRMASAYAKSWGSTFVRVPSAGHINVESGHGEWPLGWALLGALASLAPVQAQAA